MKVLVEITHYPLRDDHLAVIDHFLELLHEEDRVEVKTSRMSTLLYGDYDLVMEKLKNCIAASHAQFGSSAFVFKLIPGAARTLNGYE